LRPHPRLPLPLTLLLRTHLGRQRALSLITLCAVAASVALATGLEMSSRSAEAEFEHTTKEMAGAAQIEVVGGSLGIPEELLNLVATVPGVKLAAPLVQASFHVDRPDAEGSSLHVLGVDLLADPSVRSYSGEASVEDPLRLISGSDAVVVARALADKLKLRSGDPLPLRSRGKSYTLTVRGVLAPQGLAAAYGGQIAIMDVYALQTLLGREGWLDKIDVLLSEGASTDAVMAGIEHAVSGRASVRHAATRDVWSASALALVRTIVAALLVVAILVASLVSFSALSLFVDRRIPELALLQVAGLEPRRVRRILYVDAALLALFGTVAGALLGWVFAAGFLGGLSWLLNFLQGIELSRIDFGAATAGAALGVGGLVSFAGVLEPARRATRQAPLDALLGFTAARQPEETGRRRVWLAAALAAVAGLSAVVGGLPPLVRVVGILTAGLALLGVVVRSGLPALLRRTGQLIDVVRPGIGRLAGASLAARPGGTALATVSVAGVVAGVTISLALAHSTAQTIDTWMQSQFPGGVFVTAGPVTAIEPDEFVSPETLRTIRETPGVRGVFDQVAEKLVYRGEQVFLMGGRMEVMARFGRLAVMNGDPREVAEEVARGALVVSDRFAQHFGVAVGDTISLDTPKGLRSFRVAGVNRDYSGPAGSINIDSSVFEALWPRRGARDLVLWSEGDPAPVISEIRRRVGETQTLFFAYGDDLAHFASRVLLRFQMIVMSVALLTAVLGGIAIWNVMLGAVTVRRRELALLLATGATRRQIRALTLIDALLLAGSGGVGGIVLGLCSGYLVVSSVMTDAVGWSLTFSVAPGELLTLMAGLLCAALLASLYPAWLASRVPMGEVSGVE